MLGSLWHNEMQLLEWGIAAGAALVAAAIDVRTHRIPNLLTGSFLLAGLARAMCVGGAGGLIDGMCGMLVMGLPFFVLWTAGAGGAGDAKMMMALGAWLGIMNGAVALVAVSLMGGLVSLGYAIHRRQVGLAVENLLIVMGATLMLSSTGRPVKNRQDLIPSIHSRQAFPYGIAIFLGTAAAAVGVLWWRG